MKRLLVILALLSMGSGLRVSDASLKAECHRECYSCETRCRLAKDYESCKLVCLEVKRSCCAGNGFGGGPRTTCSCS